MKGKSRTNDFSMVTVGERGQVVIPASIRKSLDISPGDKMIVLAKPDMIGIIPAQEFTHFITQAHAMMDKIGKIS